MATANPTCEKADMRNHPEKLQTYRRRFVLGSCSCSCHGRDTPSSKQGYTSWLGQRHDGCHHVIALICKPWLRKRKLVTKFAARKRLLSPKRQRLQPDLDDKDGSVSRILPLVPPVFSAVSHFRVYCECDVTVVKQLHHTFETPTYKTVPRCILFTSTFTTQFSLCESVEWFAANTFLD